MKRAANRQLRVQNVLLRDQSHPVAKVVEVRVQVAPGVPDAALVCRPETCQRVEQCRLAGPARADDREQRLAFEREAHAVEEPRAVHANDEVGRLEGDVASVDVLCELSVHQPKQLVPDAHDVGSVNGDAAHPSPVDMRAVVAVEIYDLPAVGGTDQLCVPPGDEQVRKHDVVVRGPADAHLLLDDAVQC